MFRNLFKDSIIYTIANLFSKGFAIIILPLYTRVLSQEDYGNLDLIFILSILIVNVSSLQIMQAVARFTSEQESKLDLQKLFSTAFWFLIISYTVSSILFVLFKKEINHVFFKSALPDHIYYLFIIYTFINGVWILLLEQFRWELKTKQYSYISFLYALMNFILGYLFAYEMKLGLTGVLLSIILSLAIVSIISVTILKNRLSFCLDICFLKQMLYLSTPLIPAALIGIISIYASRLSIGYFLTAADLGLYSVALRISSISLFLLVGIQGALTPLIYYRHQEEDTPQKLAFLFHLFTVVCLIFCLFITLFSKELLAIFTNEAYISAYAWIGILSISLLLNEFYIFFPGIGIFKQTKLQLKISLITFLISIISNIFLVYTFKTWGAVISSLLTSLSFFIFWVRYSQKKYFLNIFWKDIIFLFSSYILIFLYYTNLSQTENYSNNLLIKIITILLYVFLTIPFIIRLSLKSSPKINT